MATRTLKRFTLPALITALLVSGGLFGAPAASAAVDSDTSLKVFNIVTQDDNKNTLNTYDALKNSTIQLAANELNATLVPQVVPTNSLAIVSVARRDIDPASFYVDALVTAADGTTKKTYTVLILNPTSPDATLQSFTVNDINVLPPQPNTVDLPSSTLKSDGSLAISVQALPTSITASLAEAITESKDASGNPISGQYILSITVTPSDKAAAPKTYTATLNIGRKDSSLASLTIGGISINTANTTNKISVPGVILDDKYTLVVNSPDPAAKNSLSIALVPTNPLATASVNLLAGSQPGDYVVDVKITAPDGVETTEWLTTVTVTLPQNPDLASLAINGHDALTPGTTVTTPAGATSVKVDAAPKVPGAKITVTGDKNLIPGNNTLKVDTIAPDGLHINSYSVTVYVPMANDATLSKFTVNDQDVLTSGSVAVPFGTTSAAIVAVPTNTAAKATLDGPTILSVGDNIFTVTVTAADGVTKKTYKVDVVMAAGTGGNPSPNPTTTPTKYTFAKNPYFDVLKSSKKISTLKIATKSPIKKTVKVGTIVKDTLPSIAKQSQVTLSIAYSTKTTKSSPLIATTISNAGNYSTPILKLKLKGTYVLSINVQSVTSSGVNSKKWTVTYTVK